MSDPISFACRSCQQTIEAALSEVGRPKTCPHCGDVNHVPFPRVKVSGGFRSAHAPAAPKAAPAVHALQPAGGSESTRPSQQPQGAQETAAEVQSQGAKETTAEVQSPKVRRSASPGSNRFATYLAYSAVFFACVAGGWLAVSSEAWTDGLGDRLAAMTKLEVAEESVPQSAATVDVTRYVEEVVMASRAARLARESIETDLNVSLAEMQSRGMQSEADVVRKAIERKSEQIKIERERASVALQALLRNIPGEPAGRKSVLDAQLQKTSLVLNAAESALLEKVGVEMMSAGESGEVLRKALSVWEQSI